jgi:hypothetical protein
MKRTERLMVFIICLISGVFAIPLLSGAEEDLCHEQGIIIGNQTMLDLWYKKNGGDCTIWRHGHILTIKPEDTVGIFSDMICEKGYCTGNTIYNDLKPFDTDLDCRVRILPACSLSDM